MNLRIDKERIRTHFTYSWWQYLILVVVAIFGWNLLYTSTGYRSPANLKMDFYYQGPVSDEIQNNVTALVREICDEIKPEIEEITFVQTAMDETYGPMQLTVWIAAGEGDLYLLDYDNFQQTSAGMIDLQPYIDDGTLPVGENFKLKRGQVRDEELGRKVQYGIPAENLPGITELGLETKNKVFSVLAAGGNVDATVQLLAKMMERFAAVETTAAE